MTRIVMMLRPLLPDDSSSTLQIASRAQPGCPSAPVIKVTVHEGDPLSRAGVASHITQQHDMTETTHLSRDAGASKDLAVVLLDRVDATAAVRLRKLSADRRQRVVLVVGELDENQLELVMEAGIHTIVWRHEATRERLLKAIHAAGRDESDIPSDLLRRLMNQLGRRARETSRSTPPAGRPTARELSVLKLVAQGLGTKEIADRLSYSERTVKGILHDVMMRLHLKNRAHAVAYAIREGYI
ncbi:LuxR C-terminal-related transcriptional regulator [Streptomyces sp. NPDC006012]|uniref:helix-turn-helix transcriptional regulator n=1 Tax=Streptomyces sp. NPDC006012 TaxID=3364739 RepID=UPI0036933BF1